MNNRSVFLLILIAFLLSLSLKAQSDRAASDEELLNLYKGLRVADVSDGMDIIGLRDIGLMDQRIQALWKDIEKFDHMICGIALTVRYVPTNKIVKNPMNPEEFSNWEGEWYNTSSSEPFIDQIKNGSVIVLDVQGDGDTGSVGSFNSLNWYAKGAAGIVSNGGIRDTDEIIKQRIPVYLDWEHRGRGIRPGRNELESTNKPVTIGGVLVNPGDIIVADGDGVIVVPRKYAEQVAGYARKILNSDKEGRKNLYNQLKKPLDNTVND
jgi:4-hydroxy-4-methyl-2-oxoglutarate aldolase